MNRQAEDARPAPGEGAGLKRCDGAENAATMVAPATRAVNPDAAFLTAVFGDLPEQCPCFHLWACTPEKPPKHKDTYWCRTVADAVAAAQRAADRHVYYGIGLSTKPGEPTERVKADTVAGIVGLVADIDIGTHDNGKHYCPDQEAAEALIGGIGLLPTAVIHSGGGLQALWLFREPWTFDTDAERDEGAALSRGWAAHIAEVAGRHGYQVDAVHDLARVMRLPGTWNVKPEYPEPRPVTILRADYDRRYNPSAFADFVPATPEPEPTPARTPTATPVPAAEAPAPRHDLTDEQLLAKAAEAKNGDRFEQLWCGDMTGYPSQSEADLALCNLLAFWTGPDPARIERLFSQSALADRGKWRERADYRQDTIGKALAGRTEYYSPGGRKRDRDADQGTEPDADDEPQAELLFRLARAEGDLFRDPQHEAYCTLPVAGHSETYRLSERGGGGLRAWMARRYREERGRTPNPAALQTAVTGICAEAAIAPVKHVGLRVAATDEGRVLWLDLADTERRVVRIAGDGWTLTQDLPEDLRFLRPPGLQPLPEPKADAGGFKQLRCLLANVDDDGFRLCVSWMVAALRPDVPCPILVLTGPQGSAKSSAAKTLRMLIDPVGLIGKGTTRPPKDDKDLFAVASAQHVCCIDNLSRLSGDLADALAALTTGDGLTARRLYSDFESVSCYAMRPLLLNGIGGGAADVCARPDLLDRALSVTLTPIADLHRVAESDYWPAVRAAAPAVLGDLCDALATALHNLPNTRLPALPRMADFACWIVAAEPALPWDPGTFLAAYSDNRRAAVDLLLETDPVAGHLRALADMGAWEGTTAELLAELDNEATDREKKSRRWPKSASALGKHLARIGPALEQSGLLLASRKTMKGRVWALDIDDDGK